MPKPKSNAKSTALWSPGDIVPKPEFEARKWSGLDMWECKSCHWTTFDEGETKDHECKTIRYVKDQIDGE